MRRSRLTGTFAMAAVIALSAAACGGASTPAPATAGAPTTASTAAAGTPAATVSATTPAGTASGATASPAGAATDPCSLLSAADLLTVTGAKYATGVFDTTYNWCDFIGSQADGGGEVILAISDNKFADVKGALTQGVDLTISGHAAFWDPEQGVQSMLVDVGGKTLELSFPKAPKDGAVDQAMAQKLTELALGKM